MSDILKGWADDEPGQMTCLRFGQVCDFHQPCNCEVSMNHHYGLKFMMHERPFHGAVSSTSPRHPPPGSTPSRVSLPSSRTSVSSTAYSDRCGNSEMPSTASSTTP